jgi:tRNA pseudouridine38-40 synthase
VPTQRYKLTLAYRGTRYHGWQFQAANPLTWKGAKPPAEEGIPTVQAVVAKAFGSLLGHAVDVVGSSRTDAGVHAKGQVAHFDTDQVQIPPEGLRRAVNARLPDDVLVRTIEPVPDSFNAISSTASKRYQYFIWNAEDRPLFFSDLAWHRWQKLDDTAMAAAAAQLVGEHDFASFAKPGHGRDTTVRRVLECAVHRRGARLVIGVEGTGFLWNMVRIIVGTLVEVGLGRFAPADMGKMLAARDRRAAGGTAPPHGLYLQWVRLNCPEKG